VRLKPRYHKRHEAKRILKPCPMMSSMSLTWWKASTSTALCAHMCFTQGRFATYLALAVWGSTAKFPLISAAQAHRRKRTLQQVQTWMKKNDLMETVFVTSGTYCVTERSGNLNWPEYACAAGSYKMLYREMAIILISMRNNSLFSPC